MLTRNAYFTIARPQSRDAAVRILQHRIERRRWPRGGAFLIALIAALVALVAATIMWRNGLEDMGTRYPITLVVAYLTVLPMLWIWARWASFDWQSDGSSPGDEGRDCDPLGWQGGGGEFGGAGASDSFAATDSGLGDLSGVGLDVPVSGDESAIIVLPLALVAVLLCLFGAAALSLANLIWKAPTLLSELMIDADSAILLGVFVPLRLRRSWLATAIAQTWRPFFALALVVTLCGFVLEWIDPTAITIVDVWRNLHGA